MEGLALEQVQELELLKKDGLADERRAMRRSREVLQQIAEVHKLEAAENSSKLEHFKHFLDQERDRWESQSDDRLVALEIEVRDLKQSMSAKDEEIQALKAKMGRLKFSHEKQVEELKIKHTQEMYIVKHACT